MQLLGDRHSGYIKGPKQLGFSDLVSKTLGHLHSIYLFLDIMAADVGTVSHLLPPSYKRMVSAWLEEDCPSFDYGGFVVGEEVKEARLLGKSPVGSFPTAFSLCSRCEDFFSESIECISLIPYRCVCQVAFQSIGW